MMRGFFYSSLVYGLLAAGAAFWGSTCSLPAHAQRLSDVAIPQHYSLSLAPNLGTATFAGKETIDVTLTRPVNEITLNAIQIKFDSVTARFGGETLPAEVTLDPAKQQATFHFPETLPAGPLSLNVKYSGILNSDLRGFYLSKTLTHRYAVTQFEATDARRAFPSFDEPALKASFDISLIIPKNDTAISNMNMTADTPGPSLGEHTVRFKRTPRMSTYLVAFLVGDFQCLAGQSDEVPIRVCATPENVQDGAFALSAAEFFLHYYDQYFGIKYPMPKLDLIAIPDFEAGAMENFGAITYRETALLVDPKTASVASRKLVAVDVAHEMAHQWFGDMVTMQWWNNIWLNEGFATWMENKAVAAWKPEWQMSQDVAATLNTTLNLDAQQVTRTIRAMANTPDEINQMFDGITYDKAAALLLMVENYVGEQTFRRGVHAYLAGHIYGNATAEDFWNTQTEVSHQPVDKIMESFVTQPGEPLLSFGAPHGGKVEVMQQRFFLNPKVKAAPDLLWTVPVCMRSSGKGRDCQILKSRTETLNVAQAPLFYGNARGKGYYRIQYDKADYQKLVAQVEAGLDPEERIILLGSEWALTRADRTNIGDFLNLADAVKDDRSPDVIGEAVTAIASMDQRLAATKADQQMLAEWVRTSFTPAYERLGPPSKGDTPDRKELRAELFALLGNIGDEPEVIAQSKQIVESYLANPGSPDATLAYAALTVAAHHGDRALFDRLQKISETAEDPQLRVQALFSLARFRDPALVERALQYAVSGTVKDQDSIRVVASELMNRYTQDQAWRFIEEHWPKVDAQFTTLTGATLVGAAGSFCSAERHEAVTDFFRSHHVPASATALERAQNNIDDCIEFRAKQNKNMNQWLSKAVQSSVVTAGD